MKLHLTQEQFAKRYGIPLSTLRDWEQYRTDPDQAAQSYIQAIEAFPEAIAQALSKKHHSITLIISSRSKVVGAHAMPMKNPPHPGRLVKESIAALGLSVAQGAEGLGVTRQQLYRVINGTCGVTPEMAVRLERGVGSTADAWLKMQLNYDLAQIQLNGSRAKNSPDLMTHRHKASVSKETFDEFLAHHGILKAAENHALKEIPIMPRETDPEILKAMRDSEMPPEFIFAYKKTGYVVLTDSEQTLPDGAREQWESAIEEYFRLEADAPTREA